LQLYGGSVELRLTFFIGTSPKGRPCKRTRHQNPAMGLLVYSFRWGFPVGAKWVDQRECSDGRIAKGGGLCVPRYIHHTTLRLRFSHVSRQASLYQWPPPQAYQRCSNRGGYFYRAPAMRRRRIRGPCISVCRGLCLTLTNEGDITCRQSAPQPESLCTPAT
jgi:hypothetical protein